MQPKSIPYFFVSFVFERDGYVIEPTVVLTLVGVQQNLWEILHIDGLHAEFLNWQVSDKAWNFPFLVKFSGGINVVGSRITF